MKAHLRSILMYTCTCVRVLTASWSNMITNIPAYMAEAVPLMTSLHMGGWADGGREGGREGGKEGKGRRNTKEEKTGREGGTERGRKGNMKGGREEKIARIRNTIITCLLWTILQWHVLCWGEWSLETQRWALQREVKDCNQVHSVYMWAKEFAIKFLASIYYC